MNLRAWLVIVLAIALPLICVSMVLFLVNTQYGDRLLRNRPPQRDQEQLHPLIH